MFIEPGEYRTLGGEKVIILCRNPLADEDGDNLWIGVDAAYGEPASWGPEGVGGNDSHLTDLASKWTDPTCLSVCQSLVKLLRDGYQLQGPVAEIAKQAEIAAGAIPGNMK